MAVGSQGIQLPDGFQVSDSNHQNVEIVMVI
jgi:hypothetical protein